MVVALSQKTLAELPASVQRPAYDRAKLKPGIVHFGVGNFCRAHLATYLDDLFDMGLDHDWGIVGAGVRQSDESMRAGLASQDFLSTVVEQEEAQTKARVIGAMIDFVPPRDVDRLHAALVDPAIRIVSMTITEGGYFLGSTTGAVDLNHPDLLHDAHNPDLPRTVFGHIAKALRIRRTRGVAPFTVLSCDNVPHNGQVTRHVVTALAEYVDKDFALWVGTHVAFPNSMVDRITPATGKRERESLADQFGIADRAPVFCEGFRQWVVEDQFSAGRPAFERVGVTFVDDVTAHEQMKLRILNGSHAAIAYPAALLDIHFVHDAMQDRDIRGYLEKLAHDELISTVPPIPGTVVVDYCQTIVRRFSNPKIGDTIRRLCEDGANRQPKFIVPSILVRLRAGASVDGLALESALWCRYCAGVSDSGTQIEPNDCRWSELRDRAVEARNDPASWLELDGVYESAGRDLRFRAAFERACVSLQKRGTRATLQFYMSGSGLA